MSNTITLPEHLVNRILNTLEFYANESSYYGKRIGGVAAGCPRGPKPTPQELMVHAQLVYRSLLDEIHGLQDQQP